MGSLVIVIFTLFFLTICMQYYSIKARLLPAIVSAKPPHYSISLQVGEKNGLDEIVESTRTHTRVLATSFPKGEYGELLKGNAQNNKKIDGVFKEGKDIVESSSYHHVALLKGNHVKDIGKPPYGKEEVTYLNDDDIVVMDYQPPHRKTPIHNR